MRVRQLLRFYRWLPHFWKPEDGKVLGRFASGQALTTADHIRLGFGCPLIARVLMFNVAESSFHELETEESGMLSPLPSERRRSQRLQTAPNQAVMNWWDCWRKRSSKGYILNISDRCPYDLGLAATLRIDLISSVLGPAGSDRFSNSGE